MLPRIDDAMTVIARVIFQIVEAYTGKFVGKYLAAGGS